MDTEPTHALPRDLERKLLKAKQWYDERDLDAMTSDQIAHSDAKGADLLVDIIEIIDQSWGFASPLPPATS